MGGFEMEIFKICDLTFTYPLRKKPALCDITFSIKHGEFITFCGRSGCGKSTLLRHLKTVLTPYGEMRGEVQFNGCPLADWDLFTQSSKIGFVLQSPDNQIVTDKVWHELAFGLESLGLGTPAIRLRVAETASFFGIQNWFYKNVAELSGGQKQLLNLASVLVMQPEAIILDEPTGQLDPVAAGEFVASLVKINREFGTTIILSEHRLEEVLPVSDRVLVMEDGKILAEDAPEKIGETLQALGHDMFISMPAPMRIYAGLQSGPPCPVTIRDGRAWLFRQLSGEAAGRIKPVQELKKGRAAPPDKKEVAITLRDVFFKYDKASPDAVKNLSLAVQKGEFFAVLGGNGTGKTTALSIMAGLLRPYRGKVLLEGRDITKIPVKELYFENLGVLPQNPQALFVKNTVELDLLYMLEGRNLSKEEKDNAVMDVSRIMEITDLLSMHPHDLSGGEMQRAALAKVLLLKPRILLLDEPTKGMDGHFKREFAKMLDHLRANGAAIVMMSHDIEFCASYADRCALFFDGGIITENTPRAFFSGNRFYTTAANRMARDFFPDAITAEDVILKCRELTKTGPLSAPSSRWD